jgi:hypothetical protein
MMADKSRARLQEVITNQKTVIASLQKLASDLSKAADSLQAWGSGEGDDLAVRGI